MMSAYVANTYTVPDSIPRGLDTEDQCQALLDWVASIPNGPGALRDIDGNRVYDEHGASVRGVNRLVFDGEFHVDQMFRPIGRLDLWFDFGETGKFTRVNFQTG